MTARPLLLAALVALPTLAAAEPRQHGNVILDLPDDWSAGANEDGNQTFLYDGPEERCTYCYIYVGTGGPAEGAIDRWLAGQRLRFVDEDDRDAVEVLSEPEVIGTEPRQLAMTGQKVDGDIQILFAIQAGDRYEVFAFEAWGYDEEEVTRNMAFFQDEVTPLFDRFRYVSEGAAPLMPPALPGELSGLYWGWFQNLYPALDGTLQMRMEHRWLVFWPDGHFYDGTPPRGLGALDPAALRAAGDPNWGTYRAAGARLALTYVTGETELLSAEGEGWADGSRTLTRVEPLPDGAPLDGTISDFSYTGFVQGSGVEGGVASSSSTTFHPDGTYEGESFGGAFGTFTDGGGTPTGGFSTGGDTQATGGRYKVKDGLVVMSPADGSPPTSDLAYVVEGEILLGDQFLDAE